MPDQRQHRGRHPADEALFAPAQRPTLRRAGEVIRAGLPHAWVVDLGAPAGRGRAG